MGASGSVLHLDTLAVDQVGDVEEIYKKNKELNKQIKLLEQKSSGQNQEQEEEAKDDIITKDELTKVQAFDDFGIYGTLSLRMPDIREVGSSNVVELTRGGIYVKTKYGPIQFGIPPDTIKDSMKLGLTVPKYFVVPHERFHLELGINVCEVEFPAYFNFFILQSSVNLLVTKGQENAIRTAFGETLEGPPQEYLYQDEEYGKFAPPELYDARPDLYKEIAFFKEPRGGRIISPDTLISYLRFDGSGVVSFDMNTGECSSASKTSEDENEESKEEEEEMELPIKIVDDHEKMLYKVYEDGEEIATVRYSEASFLPTPEILNALNAKLSQALEDEEMMGGHSLFNDDTSSITDTASRGSGGGSIAKTKSITSNVSSDYEYLEGPVGFKPPDFGVTMLGSSHGFDGEGTTTGFILWVYGFGIAVDPPPHCDSYLLMNGVSPRLINTVILTHCHADHDAGTFQRVLKERRVKLITTKTIFSQFLRKYSAISGFSSSFLLRLFDFDPVKIGEPYFVNGAQFDFFYSFHALPCVGFKVSCGGKSISYSADTYINKEGLEKLVVKGVMTEERKNALLNFPWHCDIVLHECGVPPIHTPAETLQNLPDDIKANLYAVHIATKAAEAAGLRKAKEGFENTLELEVFPRLHNQAIKTLQLCSSIDIFRSSKLEQTACILEVAKHKRIAKGTSFTGELGGIFFILTQGILQLKRKKRPARLLQIGDYFGEISAMNGEVEIMTLYALTEVEMIVLGKHGFNQFLRFCPKGHARLKALEASRSQGFTKSVARNSILRNLTFPQRTQLRALTEKLEIIVDKTVLFENESNPEKVLLLCSGALKLTNIAHTKGNIIKPRVPLPILRLQKKRKSNAAQRLVMPHLSQFEIGPGTLFIPSNIYQKAVLSEKCYDIDTEKPAYAVEAASECSLFWIHTNDLEEFLDHNPGLQLALMKHPTGVVI